MSAFLLLCSIGVNAQSKPQFNRDTSLHWAFISSHNVYPDTMKCLFHEWRDDMVLDKWTPGYIILISGFIKSKHVSWSPEYANVALGYFDNIFLYDDKHLVKNHVLQVIIAE